MDIFKPTSKYSVYNLVSFATDWLSCRQRVQTIVTNHTAEYITVKYGIWF